MGSFSKTTRVMFDLKSNNWENYGGNTTSRKHNDKREPKRGIEAGTIFNALCPPYNIGEKQTIRQLFTNERLYGR